jgi:spoIIIJ-associated protein
MEWIEITGRTVAEAVDTALDELGVDEEDMEYEVIEAPRRGFLGRLGGTPTARIRARVKPISREKPNRRRRGAPRSEQPRARSGAAGEAPARREATPRRPDDGREARSKPEVESGDASKRNRARRSRGPRRAPGTAGVSGSTSQIGGEENNVSGSQVPLEEQVELAVSFTRGLMERFELPATVTAHSEGDDDVLVEIEGHDLGLLIGPRAATLDAVQELVRTSVQRRIGGHGARVHVDVAGYRARRQEALAEFTRQAAERALESGRDQVFEPMSPSDRKVVHDTVNEIEGLATVSEGEEPRRRVVIKVVAGEPAPAGDS